MFCKIRVMFLLSSDYICLPHKQGLKVHVLIFDGTYINQSTDLRLGCGITVSEMKTWFDYPKHLRHRI